MEARWLPTSPSSKAGYCVNDLTKQDQLPASVICFLSLQGRQLTCVPNVEHHDQSCKLAPATTPESLMGHTVPQFYGLIYNALGYYSAKEWKYWCDSLRSQVKPAVLYCLSINVTLSINATTWHFLKHQQINTQPYLKLWFLRVC